MELEALELLLVVILLLLAGILWWLFRSNSLLGWLLWRSLDLRLA
jgi:hypothetical protein